MIAIFTACIAYPGFLYSYMRFTWSLLFSVIELGNLWAAEEPGGSPNFVS